MVAITLLPVSWGGFAVSPAPIALIGLSEDAEANGPPAYEPRSSPLFDSFQYERGHVLGKYVQFAYDAANGTIKSVLGLAGELPVLFVGSISIQGFAPSRGESTVGSTFGVQGYLVSITAHDDPTGLIEIRSDMSRSVSIELPADATDVSLLAASGSWPASIVTYTVGEEQGRFLLGAGTFTVSGTRLVANMRDSDLLVFKSVPPASQNRAEWQLVLDAIAAGRVVAEMDLIATTGGQWIQNIVRYRIGLAAWALAVASGSVSVQVDSLLPGGGVVLLAFDSTTMPIHGSRKLLVKANGHEINRTEDTLTILFEDAPSRGAPRYAVLSLPGTVLAVFLPSLAAITISIASVSAAAPSGGFDLASEIAMIAALALVSAAAARMLRRRPE